MVDKIFNRVKVALSEPSVDAALKKIREGLKTPNSRRPRAVQPPRVLRQRAVARTRQAAGQTVDVARTVGTSFKTRFESLRKLSAAEVRDATAAYGRGLTNLALGRRAGSPATELPRPVEGQPPAPPVAPPAPIQTPVPIPPPVQPAPVVPRRVVIAPPIAPPASTINNYLTNVTIDPSQMVEWLRALQLWNQLKRMNRAAPKPSRPVTYAWMSPEEKRDLEKTTFSRAALEKAGWAEDEIDDYLTEQERRATLYRSLDQRLRQDTIVDAKYKFREDRITRLSRAQAALLNGKKGAKAKNYRAGSFYFNRRFKGAAYSVPTMRRNRQLVAAARPAIEAARAKLYSVGGMGRPEPFRRVNTGNVKVFYPSKWGSGRAKLIGQAESVDTLWMRRLTTMSRDRGTNNPLLRRLLQND